MKLEEMRKIAEKRTPGEWYTEGLSVETGQVTVAECGSGLSDVTVDECQTNADFIALAANTYDKLLAVADTSARAIHEIAALGDRANYIMILEILVPVTQALRELERDV